MAEESRILNKRTGKPFTQAEIKALDIADEEAKNPSKKKISTVEKGKPLTGDGKAPLRPQVLKGEGYRTGRAGGFSGTPLKQGYDKAINSGKGLLGTIGRIPGARGALGLLGGAARIATGPVGLGLTGAYYGARALGYDPFGLNTEEPRAPTPIGYDVNRDTPKAPPGARWQQTFRPDSSATGKELINAALFRAAMQGNMADRGAAAASVLVDKDKYRTGAEALAAGMENLGDQAQVSVSQDKDGFYQYYGKVDNSLNLLNKVNKSLRAIDKTEYDSMVARMLQVKPDATEQDILDTLEENGVSYTPQEVE